MAAFSIPSPPSPVSLIGSPQLAYAAGLDVRQAACIGCRRDGVINWTTAPPPSVTVTGVIIAAGQDGVCFDFFGHCLYGGQCDNRMELTLKNSGQTTVTWFGRLVLPGTSDTIPASRLLDCGDSDSIMFNIVSPAGIIAEGEIVLKCTACPE